METLFHGMREQLRRSRVSTAKDSKTTTGAAEEVVVAWTGKRCNQHFRLTSRNAQEPKAAYFSDL